MMSLKNLKLINLYIIVLVLNVSIFALFTFMFPETHSILLEENGILESLTAVLYLISLGLATFFLLKIQRTRKQWQFILIPILALIFFLDEVGWGLRFVLGRDHIFINLGPGFNMDGLHDVIELMKFFIPRIQLRLGDVPFLLAIVAIIMTCILVLIFANLQYDWIQKFRRWSRLHFPLVVFLATAVLFFLISAPLDTGIIEWTTTTLFIEEILEECAAISLLFSSFYLPTAFKITAKRKTKSSVNHKSNKRLAEHPMIFPHSADGDPI